jgi:hypothetical protein
MDRNSAEQGVNGQTVDRASGGMSVSLQEKLVRPSGLEPPAFCFGGKQLLRLFYHLGRNNGR